MIVRTVRNASRTWALVRVRLVVVAAVVAPKVKAAMAAAVVVGRRHRTNVARSAKVATCLVGSSRVWTQRSRTVKKTTVCMMVLPARRFGAKMVEVAVEAAAAVVKEETAMVVAQDLRVQVGAGLKTVVAAVVVRRRKIRVARAVAVATCLDGNSRAWTRPSRTARAPKVKTTACMVMPRGLLSGAVAPAVVVVVMVAATADRGLVGAEAVPKNFPRRAAAKAGQTRTVNAARSARRTAIVHRVRLASRT